MIKQFLPSLNMIDHVLSKKTLATFDFDKSYTRCCIISNVLKCNHVSENFLHLHFAADQFLDMIWNSGECHVSKNIEVKIWQ